MKAQSDYVGCPNVEEDTDHHTPLPGIGDGCGSHEVYRDDEG